MFNNLQINLKFIVNKKFYLVIWEINFIRVKNTIGLILNYIKSF